MIELVEAVSFIRTLEEFLVPRGFHCALTGSVLHKGFSDNDLDIIIYRHKLVDDGLERNYITQKELTALLSEYDGMLFEHKINTERYKDDKQVYRYTFLSKKNIIIDIFTLI